MSVDSTQVVQSLLTIPSAVSTESTDNGGNEMQQYFVVSNLITVLFASQQGAGNDRANPRLGASGGSSISGSVDSLDGLTEVPPITLDPNRAPTDKVSATMQGMGILAFYDLAMKNGSLTPKLKDWIIHRLNCILGSGFLDPQFKDIITKGAGAVNEGSSLADKISWGAKDEKIDPLQILVAKIILWAADWKNNTMAQPDEDTLAASVFLFQDLGTTDNSTSPVLNYLNFSYVADRLPVIGEHTNLSGWKKQPQTICVNSPVGSGLVSPGPVGTSASSTNGALGATSAWLPSGESARGRPPPSGMAGEPSVRRTKTIMSCRGSEPNSTMSSHFPSGVRSTTPEYCSQERSVSRAAGAIIAVSRPRQSVRSSSTRPSAARS